MEKLIREKEHIAKILTSFGRELQFVALRGKKSAWCLSDT